MEHAGPSPAEENEDVHGGDEEVMSEVHLGCPPGFSGSHISRFTVSLPLGNNSLLPLLLLLLLPSFT